jgi:hypothetical protein
MTAVRTCGRSAVYYLKTAVVRAGMKTHYSHSTLHWYVVLLVLAWNTSTDKGGLFLTCTLPGAHTSKGHAAMSRTVYVRQSLIKWRYWNDPTDVRSKVIFAHKKYSWHQQWRNIIKHVTTMWAAGCGNTQWIIHQENRGRFWINSVLSAQDLASRTHCSGKKIPTTSVTPNFIHGRWNEGWL